MTNPAQSRKFTPRSFVIVSPVQLASRPCACWLFVFLLNKAAKPPGGRAATHQAKNEKHRNAETLANKAKQLKCKNAHHRPFLFFIKGQTTCALYALYVCYTAHHFTKPFIRKAFRRFIWVYTLYLHRFLMNSTVQPFHNLLRSCKNMKRPEPNPNPNR